MQTATMTIGAGRRFVIDKALQAGERIEIAIAGLPQGTDASGVRLALCSPIRATVAACVEFAASGQNVAGELSLATAELAALLSGIATGRLMHVAAVVFDAATEAVYGSGYVPVVALPIGPQYDPIPEPLEYVTQAMLDAALANYLLLSGVVAPSTDAADAGKAADAKATGDALAERPTRAQVDAGWWSEWVIEPDDGVITSIERVMLGPDEYAWIAIEPDGYWVNSDGQGAEDATHLEFDSGEQKYTATRHRVCAPVPTKPGDIGAMPSTATGGTIQMGRPSQAEQGSITWILGQCDAAIANLSNTRNLLGCATGTALSPGTAVYRTSATLSGTDATIPTPDATGIPTAAAYFCFELEVSVDATATSIAGPSGWTWLDGGELPTSGFAGATIYIAARLDCATRAVLANVWRVEEAQ